MPVNETVVDALGINNVKTLGEAAAHSMAMSFENSVNHQNRMNILAESALGAAVKRMNEVDPSEAVAILKATSGNEVASQISALMAAISSNQQGAKTAQTTPPVTGGGIPPV